MNYYPFYNIMPVAYGNARNVGLFSRIFKGINFSSILNGTQKTINFMNQAIPMVKQISPLVKNTKTMFKVMNEFRKSDKAPVVSKAKLQKTFEEKKEPNNGSILESNINNENLPTFFL